MGWHAHTTCLAETSAGSMCRLPLRTCKGVPVARDADGAHLSGHPLPQPTGRHDEPLEEQVRSTQHLRRDPHAHQELLPVINE